MPKFNDLTGKKFGRLTVICRADNTKSKKVRWLCKCDCGKTTEVVSSNLTVGKTQSCGCLNREHLLQAITKHGMRKSRIYNIWLHMIDRCENPKNTNFAFYGGRGITICKEWHDPIIFAKWAKSNGYSDKLTIDRIDVNKGYSPQNCRWASRKVQSRNKRDTRYITYNGKRQSLMDWVDEYNLTEWALRNRIRRGWSIDRALNTPVFTKGR